MKTHIIFFTILFIKTVCAQQTTEEFKTIYDDLCQQNNDSTTISHLKKWEHKRPDDAEMFICGFNFYLQKSKRDVIRLDGGPAKGQNLQVMDSTNSEPVGYIYGDISYNEELFEISIDYLTRGLKKNPKRLDMYFGKIFTLGQREMFEDQTKNILSMLEYGRSIDHKWLWKMGEPRENAVEAEKGGVQDYIYNMFDQPTPVCEYITIISTKLIEIYPNDIFGYSNIGACNLVNQNFSESISWFKKAEKINSNDPIVLSNIAYAYTSIGKKSEAIEYYEKVASTDDEQYKVFARHKIEELKK